MRSLAVTVYDFDRKRTTPASTLRFGYEAVSRLSSPGDEPVVFQCLFRKARTNKMWRPKAKTPVTTTANQGFTFLPPTDDR